MTALVGDYDVADATQYGVCHDACCVCGARFTNANPCCCDLATNDDGTHVDGVCKACCGPHARDFNSGVGFYTRTDCDT